MSQKQRQREYRIISSNPDGKTITTDEMVERKLKQMAEKQHEEFVAAKKTNEKNLEQLDGIDALLTQFTQGCPTATDNTSTSASKPEYKEIVQMRKQVLSKPKNLDPKEYKDTGLLQLDPRSKHSSRNVTEERLLAILPHLEKYYELWLAYPDKFIEMMSSSDNAFKLLPFQIIMLRTAARYQRSMVIATRGASKSFTNVLSRKVDSVLLPRNKSSLLAEHKNQATKIASEKFAEFADMLPALEKEIDYKKGSRTTQSDMYVRKIYHHKSQLDIVGIENSTRGGRRHSLLFEEIKDLDATKINENVLPLLNIARRTLSGVLNPNEIHKKQVYVGSAGFTDTFAHDKAIEIMIDSVLQPDRAIYYGFDYKVPVYYGLLNEDFVEDLRNSGTYTEAGFSREFGSKWSATIEGSFFDAEKLRGLRKAVRFEERAKNAPDTFYIASMDIGRTKAQSVIEIFRIRRAEKHYNITLSNIILLPGRHFLKQSIKLKQLDTQFNFYGVIVDSQGMGHGFVDFLTSTSYDEDEGVSYPPWGVHNIEEYPDLAKDVSREAVKKIYVLKTGMHNAGLIHSNCFNYLFSGKVSLLIDEQTARAKLLQSKKGQKMSLEERKRFLEPYRNTSLLIRETANMGINRKSASLQLEKIRSGEEKDTFSALEYGLWYIAMLEKAEYSGRSKRKVSFAAASMKN